MRPLSRKVLPTLRGWETLGARERSILFTRSNWSLVTVAGNAFSTRTGPTPSLALLPQTRVPRYASFLRMLWTVGLFQSLPLGLAMPSSLRMRTIFIIPLRDSARSKMRLTMPFVSGSGSRVGLSLGPSCTLTFL